MDVALVTETYPPEVNGVAMTLQRWMQGLAQRGHQVTVYRPRQRTDVARRGAPVTAPTTVLREVLLAGASLPGYPGLQFGWPAAGKLARHWRQRRPDIVHIATEGPLGWSAIRTAQRLRLPIASSFHTNFHSYGKHYGWGRLEGLGVRYLRWLHNRTGMTLTPTAEMRSLLRQEGFRNLRVVGRGVDLTLFSPTRRSAALRQSWGAGENDLVVAYVGRLAPEKNLALVARTFTALGDHANGGSTVKCVLVGDGPARADLEQMDRRWIFAGTRRGAELAEHYASADMLLFPSLTETFGNVVTEGMASGLAVVAFDYAAARRYIRHEENGLTAPFNDSERFTRLAVGLAQERDTLRRLGAAAHHTAQRLSWDRIIRRYERLLTLLVKKKFGDLAIS